MISCQRNIDLLAMTSNNYYVEQIVNTCSSSIVNFLLVLNGIA